MRFARLTGNSTRQVSVHATGSRHAARTALDRHAARLGVLVDDADGHPRAWLRRPAPVPPTTEWFVTIAPAVVAAKISPRFAAAWADALSAPRQLALTDLEAG